MNFLILAKQYSTIESRVSMYHGALLFCATITVLLFISSNNLYYSLTGLLVSILFLIVLIVQKYKLQKCEIKLVKAIEEIRSKAIDLRTQIDLIADALEKKKSKIDYITPDSDIGKPVVIAIDFIASLIKDNLYIPKFIYSVSKMEFQIILKEVHNKLDEIITKSKGIDEEIKEENADTDFISSF